MFFPNTFSYCISDFLKFSLLVQIEPILDDFLHFILKFKCHNWKFEKEENSLPVTRLNLKFIYILVKILKKFDFKSDDIFLKRENQYFLFFRRNYEHFKKLKVIFQKFIYHNGSIKKNWKKLWKLFSTRVLTEKNFQQNWGCKW